MEKSIEDPTQAKLAMLKYLDYSIIESEKYGEITIPAEHNYGVSVWTKPLNEELSNQKFKEKKEFLNKQMGEESLKTYNSIVGFMSKKAETLIPSEAWYLSIIGILPPYQGQGLGPKLVQPVLSRTDALGIPTYLETFTFRNKSFYMRLGYVDVGVFIEPTTNTEYSIMKRDAQNA